MLLSLVYWIPTCSSTQISHLGWALWSTSIAPPRNRIHPAHPTSKHHWSSVAPYNARIPTRPSPNYPRTFQWTYQTNLGPGQPTCPWDWWSRASSWCRCLLWTWWGYQRDQNWRLLEVCTIWAHNLHWCPPTIWYRYDYLDRCRRTPRWLYCSTLGPLYRNRIAPTAQSITSCSSSIWPTDRDRQSGSDSDPRGTMRDNLFPIGEPGRRPRLDLEDSVDPKSTIPALSHHHKSPQSV